MNIGYGGYSRWKFLYCVDFNFTILVKERKVSRVTNKSETEIPASVLKTRYSGYSFCLFHNGRPFFSVIHYATAIS
jgi:hypothetical protein